MPKINDKWINHIVTNPDEFTFDGVTDKLVPAFGPILQQGTEYTSDNMNVIFGGVNDANTFYKPQVGSTANSLILTTPTENYTAQDETILQIKIELANTGAMDVTIDGNNYELRNEDGTAFTGGDFEVGQRIKFVYEGAPNNFFVYAPSAVDEWGGLEFVIGGHDNGRMYGTDYLQDTRFELDANTGIIVHIIDSDETDSRGIGGIIDRLYMSTRDQDDVDEIDPDTLLAISSANSPSSSPAGIGGTDDRLYLCDYAADDLYELDVDTKLAINTVSAPSTLPQGMGGIDNKVYVTDNQVDNIYELDLDTLLPTNTVSSPSGGPRGIGGTLNDLYHTDDGTNKIYKLDANTLLSLSDVNSPSQMQGLGGIKSQNMVNIAFVTFEDIEYELTDDSCFRVNGVDE